MEKLPIPALKAIVIGTSAGGFQALSTVLAPLPRDFAIPILIVRHQRADSDDFIVRALNQISQLNVHFASEGDCPKAGNVYIAPPDRHLEVNSHGCMTLSESPPINYSRPSIDRLFESAARYYGDGLLAAVLTGANSDGAQGAAIVKQQGGSVLVQDPDSAEVRTMPEAAIKRVKVDYVVWLDQIGPQLWTLTQKNRQFN